MSYRSAILLAFVFGASAAVAAGGCEFIASVDRADIPQADGGTPTGSGGGVGAAGGGGGATGGAGGMGAMGGGGMGAMGGGGMGGGCTMASDCGPTTTCETFTCTAGMCDSMKAASGTACTEMNGKKCDGNGVCVECLVDMDCTGMDKCDAQHNCSPPGCTNMAMDGMETDVDCGGPVCSKCADTKMCVDPTDCLSGVCTANVCIAPTCSDNVKNGTETDMDCGGSCPTACAVGKMCMIPSDCDSGVCTAMVCVAPICTDNVKNGGETDVDCGGPCATKCGDDKSCTLDSDCTSIICDAGVCGLNGCTLATATDITATPTVTFVLPAYTPKCFKVTAGTDVTFNGDFTMHPLVGGKIVVAAKVPQAPPNPFNPITNTGATKTFTIAGNAGDRYGFYCNVHGTSGMNGAVFIQ